MKIKNSLKYLKKCSKLCQNVIAIIENAVETKVNTNMMMENAFIQTEQNI